MLSRRVADTLNPEWCLQDGRQCVDEGRARRVGGQDSGNQCLLAGGVSGKADGVSTDYGQGLVTYEFSRQVADTGLIAGAAAPRAHNPEAM